jgi:uncharacterized protein
MNRLNTGRRASLFYCAALFLLSVLLPNSLLADTALPPLNARVTDLTATLTKAQIDTLERLLSDFEAKKGGQIAVLIIPNLGGGSIDDYSLRLAEKWKIGRRGIDDGVILLVAKDDRKLRIEVGDGYEGALTDVESNRIIREIITPKFRQGDFFGGIQDGLTAIIGQINGEELPPPPENSYGGRPDDSLIEPFIVGMLVLASFTAPLRRSIGRFPAALLFASIAALIALFFLSKVFVLLVSVLAFIFSFFSEEIGRGGGSYGRSSSGGWSSGGSSSSYSGGGGRFSGGGSSGSW